MQVSPTTSTSTADAAVTQAVSRLPIKTLDQEDFLKLLIAQLTAQDPLNPKKDTDFIAQMAQFSALEQTRAMQSELARLRGDQEFLQASDMLGRAVELQTDTDATVAGLVSAVKVEAGTPKIVVNGQTYDLSKVLAVAVAEPQPQP